MSRRQKQLPWFLVIEPDGDTYNINAAGPNKSYIGTMGLRRCVGVYLPIAENRCFFAHINPFVHKPGSQTAIKDVNTDFGDVTREEARGVKNQTLRKLRDHAAAKEWSPQDVDDFVRAGGGRNVVIMCPHFENVPNGKTQVGKFVVDGIKEFLGGLGGPLVEHFDNDDLIGFVVDHSNGDVEVLKRRLVGPGEWDWANERFEEKFEPPWEELEFCINVEKHWR